MSRATYISALMFSLVLLSVCFSAEGDWRDVLNLLNQKRSDVGKDPVSVPHPEDIDMDGVLTIRAGTEEILLDYGFTGLADALNCAGYAQDTWSEGFDCKNEIYDILNLMYVTELSGRDHLSELNFVEYTLTFYGTDCIAYNTDYSYRISIGDCEAKKGYCAAYCDGGLYLEKICFATTTIHFKSLASNVNILDYYMPTSYIPEPHGSCCQDLATGLNSEHIINQIPISLWVNGGSKTLFPLRGTHIVTGIDCPIEVGYPILKYAYHTCSEKVPTASFTYSPEKPMVGEEITFDGSNSNDNDGPIVNYEWDFGDTNSASGQVVTHAYAKRGEYSVTLTVTDNDGLEGFLSKTIIIGTVPVASFTYSPVKPMVGGIISFDASDSNDPDGTILSYEWDLGDDYIDTMSGDVTMHLYEHPDYYSVTLTVTDNDGLKNSVSKSLDLTLREGDLLLCRSPFSRVPGFWTHVGMYVGGEQVVEAVYEQDVKEVIISPLSQWHWPQKTCVEALYVVGADNEIRTSAVSFALSQVGKPYDSCLWQKDPNGDSWYCSELVWAAYLNASDGQINIEHGPDAVGITPTEIDLDDDTVLIGEHKERIPYAGPIIMMTRSPVDLNVIDPDGLFISKQLNQIPYTVYGEDDIDNNGSIDDWVGIPKPKIGEYLLNVVPEVNALPIDTYSLEVTINGQTMVLAQDVQIQDIPTQPYKVKSKLCYSDFDDDGDVDFVDYAIFTSHWMATDCNYPNWCEGTDLDYSGTVDFNDITISTGDWLWKKIPADIDFDGGN